MAGRAKIALEKMFLTPPDPEVPLRERLSDFWHDDAVWTLPAGSATKFSGRHRGLDAIAQTMGDIFSKVYDMSTFESKVHFVFGDDDYAGARMTITAKTSTGRPYKNEYAFIAKVRDGKISEAWEFLDTAQAAIQMGQDLTSH